MNFKDASKNLLKTLPNCIDRSLDFDALRISLERGVAQPG